MPKLGQDLEQFNSVKSNYGFSGVSMNKLTSDKYTIVTLAVDKSGSVSHFNDEINKAVANVVESCRMSPMCDNLLLRVVEFDSVIEEFHGFKLLMDCNVSDYNSSNMMKPRGMTALYDVVLNSVESMNLYGKTLTDQDYKVNSLLVVVTDGDDNTSKMTPRKIKEEIDRGVTGEVVESLNTILVGVNVGDPNVSSKLNSFQQSVGFQQYVELKDATPKTLAKLAQFISKSISSTSQALGSGGPSQSLTF